MDPYQFYLNSRKAISESDEIILVGYSGLDIHLNQLLHVMLDSKAIRVVEWSGCDSYENRIKFWSDELGLEPELIHLENVLEFTDW